MTTPTSEPRTGRVARPLLLTAALVGVGVALAFVVGKLVLTSDPPPPPLGKYVPPSGLPRRDPLQPPLELASGRLSVWWDTLPAGSLSSSKPAGAGSNVHPADYTGPDSCKECHKSNYKAWSTHPHRWMNVLASEATVKGDFSGAAGISYRGGKASFERRDGAFIMRLERGGLRRTYRITQTIGSRFFQYYVGKQVEGPEPPEHHFFHKDHVLPFGYWLDEKEWIPIVHVGPELKDADRPDPFAPPDRGRHYAEYAASCNFCHTTFPLGDMFARRPQQMGEHAPLPMHWSMRGFLETAHPDELKTMTRMLGGEVMQNPMADWDAEHHAATFGVSCEACHLGAGEHVRSKGKVLPRFFPSSPYLFVETAALSRSKGRLDYGRSHDNLNWACGRCHTGGRPAFAAGMSTWNSVEYSDAARGSCYSKLRCIDCHNPHRALGPKWTASADRDDAVCLECHKQYEPAGPRLAHTHHPAGSDGARCLNCHMPRINEGLQDVVRTHMIYSPTRADMIEANHPNACNLCHTDRPIDWTLRYLKEWYNKTYDEGKLAAHYPERARPAALGWLHSDNESVRLVAADALTRARDFRALPEILGALDDPYLLNRQFAGKGLQGMLGLRLADFGYRFYMSREERRRPLDELRAKCLRETATKGP
jgi:predicted CXXCH cytochrome family protein